MSKCKLHVDGRGTLSHCLNSIGGGAILGA